MFFVFFKQNTAYEMRISDWSSDVCSSDLQQHAPALGRARDRMAQHMLDPLLEPPRIALDLARRRIDLDREVDRALAGERDERLGRGARDLGEEIGRAHV